MTEAILEMRGVVKRFPGVVAVDTVDFDLMPGEVHCLLGENGAGKSTLIRMLSGATPLDEGEIFFDGKKVDIRASADAKALGISTIYQEINLIPTMTVLENLFLGDEPVSGGVIDFRSMRRKAEDLFAGMGLSIKLNRLARNLSIAEQQMVEIAKTLLNKSRVIIMDEPTAAISDKETMELFRIINELKKAGVGIVYISHRLQELKHIVDRVTVLRDGRKVGGLNFAETNVEDLVNLMVGRRLDRDVVRERRRSPGEVVAELRNIGLGEKIRDVSLTVRRGEVLGLAGLIGARRTELMQVLFGAIRPTSGQVWIKGRQMAAHSPAKAVALGMSYLSEDRKRQGLVLGMSVAHNITLASLRKFVRRKILSLRAEMRAALEMVSSLRIATSSPNKRVRFLSGGNQQKVVLGKWLLNEADIVIFDEPTRGIDVGAKAEIYSLIDMLVDSGKAVVMVSSELPEILRMSDRIAVMSNGFKTGELANGPDLTQERLMSLMLKGLSA